MPTDTLVPPPSPPAVPPVGGEGEHTRKKAALFEPAIVRRAIADSFKKLNPRTQARNPVMFIVLIGSIWTSVLLFRDLPHATTADNVFVGTVAIWLWFTVLFANF